jgi:hypothetical protein
MIVVLAGTDVRLMRLLHAIFVTKKADTWILWNATEGPPPPAFPQCITFKAVLYVDECELLATKRVLDRRNADHLWVVWSDRFTAVTADIMNDSYEEDVVLGDACARLSRKALESISLNFGSDAVDFSSLNVLRITRPSPP